MKLVIATSNEGKLKEIKEILNEYEIVSLKEIGKNIDIEEDGTTFEENAIKKAKAIYELTHMPCISDDSGIEIEEYNGWPGVKTARILGEDKETNEYARERNEYLLEKMKGLSKQRRKAKHVTCIAYCNKDGIKTAIGENPGFIATYPRGENGFGFDEIFELSNGKTIAELTSEEKNKISSRKKALEGIRKKISTD